MKLHNSIKLKAAFLLLVFGLNTVVGFACAVGVDMSFNKKHHHDEKGGEIHVHSDGKKHHHEEKAVQPHVHNDGKKHHHKKGAPYAHTKKHSEEKKEKDDCCSDSVVKFSQVDKSAPQYNTIINPLFFTAFIATFYAIDISYPSQITGSTKYFVRSYHPPIPDIRIAIQSFQI